MAKTYAPPGDDVSLRCGGYKFQGDSFWWLLAASILCFGLTAGALLVIGPSVNDNPCTDPRSIAGGTTNGCMDAWQVSGVGVFIVALPLACFCLGGAILGISRKRWAGWTLGRVSGLLSALLVLLSVGIAVVIVYVIRPLHTFDPNINTIMVITGGFWVAGTAPLALVLLAILYRFHARRISAAVSRACCGSDGGGSGGGLRSPFGRVSPSAAGVLSDFQTDRCCSRATAGCGSHFTAIAVLVVFVCVWYAINLVLTPIWNYSSKSYLQFASPMAFYNHPLTSTDTSTDPNAQFPHGPIVLKFYLDHLVYFAYVLFLIFVGTVIQFGPNALRWWCHQRVRFHNAEGRCAFDAGCTGPRSRTTMNVTDNATGESKSYTLSTQTQAESSGCCCDVGCRCCATYGCPLGFARAEILFYLSFAGLIGFWLWYWRYNFTYMIWECAVENQSVYAELEAWSRIMGLTTVLFASFLLWPMGRNSILESAFGIPHDRGVRLHRFCGAMVLLTLWIHALLWYINWYKIGVLWHNLFSINTLYISNSAIHFDNWIVASLSQVGLLGLTIMLFIAYFLRRWSYELFLYSHHFAIVFFLIGCLHAWSFWNYAAGGMIFWAYDRSVRLFRSATTYVGPLINAEHANGITRLVFAIETPDDDVVGSGLHGDADPVSGEESDEFTYVAGQYAFLNLPAISFGEWHPFSISSAPSSARKQLSFHIKDMGAKTFTHALASLVTANRMEGGGAAAHKQVNGKSGAAAMDDKLMPLARDLVPNASGNGFSFEQDSWTPGSITVNVDGPYGRTSALRGLSGVLLVAGGIGITCMHSLFLELYTRACAEIPVTDRDLVGGGDGIGQPLLPGKAGKKSKKSKKAAAAAAAAATEPDRKEPDTPLSPDLSAPFKTDYSALSASGGLWPELRRVHLVWVVNDPNLLLIFADTFHALQRRNPIGMFDVSLYVTKSKGAAAAAPPPPPAAYDSKIDSVTSAASSGGSAPPAPAAAPAPTPIIAFHDIHADAIAATNRLVTTRDATGNGRPDLDLIARNHRRTVESLATGSASQKALLRAPASPRMMALVCAPDSLQHAVSDAAFNNRLEFHSEAFLL